jgi:hypothetical protein
MWRMRREDADQSPWYHKDTGEHASPKQGEVYEGMHVKADLLDSIGDVRTRCNAPKRLRYSMASESKSPSVAESLALVSIGVREE